MRTVLIRLGGLAAMVGSAIFALNGSLFIDWRTEGFHFASVDGFLFLLSMMAVVVAIHLLHRERERYGSRGTRAFFAAFVGVALVLGGSFLSESFPALAEIGNLLFLTGELLFLVGALAATVGIIRLAVVTLNAGCCHGGVGWRFWPEIPSWLSASTSCHSSFIQATLLSRGLSGFGLWHCLGLRWAWLCS